MIKAPFTALQPFLNYLHRIKNGAIRLSPLKKALLVTALTLPLLAANLLLLHHKQAYISDDTIQQLVVQDWEAGQSHNVLLGEDTFFLKFPIYALLNLFGQNSPLMLLGTMFLFLGGMIFLFNYLQFKLHKSLGYGLLLSLFIASFGGYVLFWLRIPNIRNIEMPLAMLSAFAATKLLLTDKPRKSLMFCLIGAMSLQAANDPYVLYVFFAPLLPALFFILNHKRARIVLRYAGLFAATYIGWRVTQYLLNGFGIQILAQHITLFGGDVLDQIKNALIGLWYVLSNKQLSGGDVINSVVPVLALPVLLYAGAQFIKNERKKAPQNIRWAFWFGLSIIAINMGTYIASGFVQGAANHRYLVGLIFGLCLVLISLSITRMRRIIMALLGLAISCNLLANVVWAANRPEVNNLEAVGTITNIVQKTSGPYVGYADYWRGNVNTFLSNRSLRILPMICNSQQITEYKWAANIPNFGAMSDKNSTFFIYLDNTVSSPSQHDYSTDTCTSNDIKRYFPHRSIDIYALGGQKTLIILGKDTSEIK